MPGSGKSLLAQFLKSTGLPIIRLGGFVEDEVIERGLPRDSSGEAIVRRALREEEGVDVLAQRALKAIRSSSAELIFVVDGVYSPVEDQLLRSELGDGYFTIAILCDRRLRYERLELRDHRHLTSSQAAERDLQEIDTLRKADTIVLADYFVLNNDSQVAFLRACVHRMAMHLDRTGTTSEAEALFVGSLESVIQNLRLGIVPDRSLMWLLIARASIEFSPNLSWQVAKAIGETSFQEGKSFLLSLATSADVASDETSLHLIAAWAVGRLNVEPEELLPLLDSGDVATRAFVVDALGELKGVNALPILIEVLEEEDEALVIEWAGLSIAKLLRLGPNEQVKSRLVRLVNRSSGARQLYAFGALAGVDRDEALSVLNRLVDSHSVDAGVFDELEKVLTLASKGG